MLPESYLAVTKQKKESYLAVTFPVLPHLQHISIHIPKTPFKFSLYNPSQLSSPHGLPPTSKFLRCIQELASNQETLEDSRNQAAVAALYDALNGRNTKAIQEILAPDLEWWFHGPPSYQFLMRLLTGEQESQFQFIPHRLSAFGPTVLAEGFDQSRSIAWVHAWTVTDGIITQVREYFNTSLTVTRFGNTDEPASAVPVNCASLWESSLPDWVGKSVPGLVLAI